MGQWLMWWNFVWVTGDNRNGIWLTLLQWSKKFTQYTELRDDWEWVFWFPLPCSLFPCFPIPDIVTCFHFHPIPSGKGRKVTTAGWQVTLCDPIWHVISCSAEVISMNCYTRSFTWLSIHFALLTFITVGWSLLLCVIADMMTIVYNKCGSWQSLHIWRVQWKNHQSSKINCHCVLILIANTGICAYSWTSDIVLLLVLVILLLLLELVPVPWLRATSLNTVLISSAG